jgi:sugar phosphate permease
MLLASRFSLGVFQAGLSPISSRVLKDWIPIRSRGISSALIVASMSVGGAFTMWLTGWLLERGYGWRVVFAAYSSIGIVWAVGFYWYFRTFPQEHHGVNAAELELITNVNSPADSVPKPESNLPATSGTALFRKIAGSLGMWGLCLQSFFRAAGYGFFVTWFFAFLEYVYEIDKSKAGMLNSLPLIAVVIGCMLGGLIVDGLLTFTGNRWISRSGTAIVALAMSGLFTMASAWTSSATELSVVIAVGALFSGIGAPAAWAATIDIGGRNTAVAMAVMNMAGGLAAVVLPTLLGNWFDQIREVGGDWNLVIYLHAAFYFLGALSWLAVNPDREIS